MLKNLKKIKKARVNGGIDNDSLKESHKSLRCHWQTRIIWQSNYFFYSA